ncbi:CDP-glycerol glycerophosphotransferase family protein [Bacillus velezensis]|nr:MULTISPECIES: CDP-glycerol glycerophosphotransferase family protein [Bacillus amyloliquefaciens group]MCU9589578.1 CDP-glycerol glycerophosphotransferase family protein [Bacillus velezensis]WJM70737.1 CDP-glycerol glycerophosphotransferase family protein [Bacillus velezensis]
MKIAITRIVKRTFSTAYKLLSLLPVQRDKVVIASYREEYLSDNFKGVYKQLMQGSSPHITLLLRKMNRGLIGRVSYLIHLFKSIYHLATCRVLLLDDYYFPLYVVPKREETITIQLWHACGAFKKFGHSIVNKPFGPSSDYLNIVPVHSNYDYAIVSSPIVVPHFAEAFQMQQQQILPLGIPRTDYFHQKEHIHSLLDEFHRAHPELKHKKKLLYAPTFRGSGHHQHSDALLLDLLQLKLALKHKGYIIMLHLHPYMRKQQKQTEEDGFVLDLSNSYSLYDLMAISDGLITDYSSVIFEYSLLKRPMYFYCPDLEDYLEERDFYYPFQSFVPGPISKDIQSLVADIVDAQAAEAKEIEVFSQKFITHQDGKSSERVANFISSFLTLDDDREKVGYKVKLVRKIKDKILRSRSKKKDSAFFSTPADDRIYSLFNNTKQVKENQQIPVRKISEFSWNQSFLKIEGFIYIKGLPLQKADLVRKRLLLVSNGNLTMAVPLRDIPIEQLLIDDVDVSVNDFYKWAGFSQNINFSKLMNDKPLPHGEYQLFLEIEVVDDQNVMYREIHTIGDARKFLSDDIYKTKMEYYSARKQMNFNLIVTYDWNEKTINLSSVKLQELNPSLLELNTGKKANRILRRLKKSLFHFAYDVCCLLPIKSNKIVFASDSRPDITGNFEFVYDELLKRKKGFDFKFFLKSSIRDRKTLSELMAMAYHFATSKVIFIDDFYPIIYPLKIRKNADLVQLWHAVGAFKTFGYSRNGLKGGPSPYSKNHRNYTKVIVSSENIRKHYAEGFGVGLENVIASGVPRTDFFFDEEKKETAKKWIYTEYPFLKDKKVILFAPTFRGDGQQSAHYPFEVLDFKRLYRELKNEYIFLLKIHPFVQNKPNFSYQYSDFFYDFSSFREINELLLVTDILITDYSSVCFEYALLNKPMIFFSYDVDDYTRKRDFYYDYFEFIPGPLAKTTEQIISTIKEKKYHFEKIDSFVHYFFDDLDGKATERVVDQIIYPQEKNPST